MTHAELETRLRSIEERLWRLEGIEGVERRAREDWSRDHEKFCRSEMDRLVTDLGALEDRIEEIEGALESTDGSDEIHERLCSLEEIHPEAVSCPSRPRPNGCRT